MLKLGNFAENKLRSEITLARNVAYKEGEFPLKSPLLSRPKFVDPRALLSKKMGSSALLVQHLSQSPARAPPPFHPSIAPSPSRASNPTFTLLSSDTHLSLRWPNYEFDQPSHIRSTGRRPSYTQATTAGDRHTHRTGSYGNRKSLGFHPGLLPASGPEGRPSEPDHQAVREVRPQRGASPGHGGPNRYPILLPARRLVAPNRFPAPDPVHFEDILENRLRPANLVKLSSTFVQSTCDQNSITLGSLTMIPIRDSVGEAAE